MSTKLYVGSLPYSTTEQQLSELFSQYGSVQSAKVITDRYTGQSRGFGFVEMSKGEEAKKAIAALHGSELGGRTLVVNEARPQEKRAYGGGGGAGGGGGEGGHVFVVIANLDVVRGGEELTRTCQATISASAVPSPTSGSLNTYWPTAFRPPSHGASL